MWIGLFVQQGIEIELLMELNGGNLVGSQMSVICVQEEEEEEEEEGVKLRLQGTCPEVEVKLE